MIDHIPKIVLTGGACGGKTTAIEYLKQKLPVLGYYPIFVPELATQLFDSGIKWKDVDAFPDHALRFQTGMVKMQMSNEDWYEGFGLNIPKSKKVIICDRGTIDNFAYLPDSAHNNLAIFCGVTQPKLKRRYDGIIHLQSLAFIDGFEQNNPARYETADEAKLMCDRTYELWERGPQRYHVRIPANTSLTTKLYQVLCHIENIVEGRPQP